MGNTYESSKPVFWFITVGKIESWTYERFHHEYNDIHAKMTAGVAEQVHDLQDYTQLMVEYDEKTDKPTRGADDNEGWHGLTIHIWSSLQALYTSFADPSYEASAKKHIFCRQDQKGCFAELLAEFASPGYVSDGSTKVRSIIFHRKNPLRGDSQSDRAWLDERSKKAKQLIEGRSNLLRYRQYLDCTPQTINHFFKGTPFAGGSWQEFCAAEDMIFDDLEAASRFLNEYRDWIYDGKKPLIITGKGYKVFGTD
ncbi:uncharacterized protein Z518_10534 [Rhinocladiella mackenziei CBS 650.93]|uniref:EthD domain-containing protein n=1 Tax=Rhinocladiella mackenziei CBS 650.93 TaxID=1442369 RepID=A0A0D2IUK0_9EURO|nr:uncharacterized protein Z518_10534 [Rhinocladiella mackenziei CBS 650.93]KIX00395.1 hypothetical protein Z518_10534 [Rhinocladiella mackenziei CBS 650.93]